MGGDGIMLTVMVIPTCQGFFCWSLAFSNSQPSPHMLSVSLSSAGVGRSGGSGHLGSLPAQQGIVSRMPQSPGVSVGGSPWCLNPLVVERGVVFQMDDRVPSGHLGPLGVEGVSLRWLGVSWMPGSPQEGVGDSPRHLGPLWGVGRALLDPWVPGR